MFWLRWDGVFFGEPEIVWIADYTLRMAVSRQVGLLCNPFSCQSRNVWCNVSSINKKRELDIWIGSRRLGRTFIKGVPLFFQESGCFSVDSCWKYVEWNPTHCETWCFGVLGFAISIFLKGSLRIKVVCRIEGYLVFYRSTQPTGWQG